MKRTLLPTVLLPFLIGCAPAPENYQKAAVAFAEDVCTGITDFTGYVTPLGSTTGKASVLKGGYATYTCITEVGTNEGKVIYKDIPVKYFKENK
ncbi:putative membrane lipoprotein [Vibrio phage 424E50-1]|nr:putative membrane lipoprotein [Vibrio phage 424E50-1]